MQSKALNSVTVNNYPEVIRRHVEEHKLASVDCELLLERIADGCVPDMDASAFARYASEVAASMTTHSPEYDCLAAFILLQHHVSRNLPNFSAKVALLSETQRNINPSLAELVARHAAKYDSMIDYSRDTRFTYFGLLTLFRSYVLKINGEPVELPQDVYMRVAIQIHRDDFEAVQETYDLLSNGMYTHSTPTMFNSLTTRPQLASCFLISPNDDTIEDHFKTLRDCATISKFAGGIGIALHDVRASGSHISSTGGTSRGIVPLIRLFNETLRYINVATVRRQSSIAFYLEPWHKDVFAFLDLRKNSGNEEMRARDVFTALWMNDLFMERVRDGKDWTLFDPHDAPGLSDVWGDAFRAKYEEYERSVADKRVVKAQELWKAIIVSQIETGTPYVVYKDTCNRTSNQQHLGTIKCSNLCTEIVEFTSGNEIAVCNLASLSLPRFVENNSFNFDKLRRTVRVVCKNLNRMIDCMFYPVPEAEFSNKKHRPIGIGVQGLADVFAMLRRPYDSPAARKLNRMIFETLYYGALEASVELAEKEGPYESWPGSLLSKGVFHFEVCGAKPSGLYDWEGLRARLKKYGARNSLLIAPMPTAGTSQITGNNECFEPFTSNIYTRRTLAGEFQVVNHHLVEDLRRLGLWNDEMRQLIIENEGSVQSIAAIPADIRELYKTVWEIKMRSIIDMAADRQAYVDQSQSLNIYLPQPTYQQVSSMHFYGWQRGLKTGMYYLRTRPISSAIKFTVDREVVERAARTLGGAGDSDENASNVPVCEGCSS